MDQACFAAGDFQAVERDFKQIPGVIKIMIGFTGGTLENPTQEDVNGGKSGHAEAILLEFDVNKITYEKLCEHFFHMHDPTTIRQRGKNVGDQYRSAIFLVNEEQRPIAEAVMDKAQVNFPSPIVTQIESLRGFYQLDP